MALKGVVGGISSVSVDGVTITGNGTPGNPLTGSGGSGSVVWGDITGTLSDQTDLQTELDSKYDASNPDGYIIDLSSFDTADLADSSNKRYVTDANLTVINNTSDANTGDQNLFKTIAVSGQSDVVADSTTDTLTLVAGTNITITTNPTTDSITITASGGSGDVTKVGTPVDNQIGVWTGDGTIEGTSGLTYNGSNLQLTGDIGSTGTRITKGWFTDLTVTNAISGSVTGNAATATALKTARNINSVAFDGTGDITITAAAGTLTGATLNSGVTASSLTSLGSQAQALNMNGHLINNVTDPSSAQDAATKNYVDSVAQGLSAKASAIVATAAALPTNTYSNGASGIGATLTAVATGVLTIDGVAVAINNRIVVKNEVAPANNGLYICTVAGAIGVAYILTRTTDADTSAELDGAFVFIESGTANTATGWVIANSSAITIGTTAISWTQFSGAGTYVAGVGLTLTGNSFAVNASQTQITAVGTIVTGVWNGTTIAVANGGTGQTSYTDGQILIGNTSGNTLAKGTLTGTANQVVVTNGGSSITLSTPQNIGTASTPQFGRLGLGQAADASAVMAATGQYFSTEYDNGNVTGTATIDFTNGNVQYATMTGNVTLTFTNPKAGGRYVLQLAGAFTPTFPAGVRWSGGSTPTATASAGHKDIYTFIYSGKESLYDGAANLNFATT